MSSHGSSDGDDEVLEFHTPPRKRFIQGRFWYDALIERSNGIYRIMPPHRWMPFQIMVQLMVDEKTRKFSLFDNYSALANYIEFLAPAQRTMNEIVPAERKRKPYFDLDVGDAIARTSNGDQSDAQGDETAAYRRNREHLYLAICLLVRALESEIPGLNLERDVLVCESERAGRKASAHVVINHWRVRNKYENEALYVACMARIRANYAAWSEEYARSLGREYAPPPVTALDKMIDPAVYGSNQNFRLLGCQKPERGNFKHMQEKWTYFGREVEHEYDIETSDENRFVVQLTETLLTFCGYCRDLPDRVTSDASSRLSRRAQRWAERAASGTGGILPMPTSDVTEALYILQSSLRVPNIQLSFTVRETVRDDDHTDVAPSGLIVLDRNMATHCPICERRHHNENPYLALRGGDVYYSCRRMLRGDGGGFVEMMIGRLSRMTVGKGEFQEVVDAGEVAKARAFSSLPSKVSVVKSVPSLPKKTPMNSTVISHIFSTSGR